MDDSMPQLTSHRSHTLINQSTSRIESEMAYVVHGDA